MQIKSYQADIALLFVAISWGTTFVLVQDAISAIPVYTFLFWRFGLAFLLMAIISWKHWDKFTKSTLWASILLGSINFFAFAFQTYALTLTLSSTVAFITGLNVIFIPFIAYLFFKRTISVAVLIGAGIAVLGLWFLTIQGGVGIGSGEIYTLLCAILVSLHILYTDRFARQYEVMLLVVIQFGVIAFASMFMGLIVDGTVMPTTYSYEFILALVTTVLFATVFAFWAQTSMQRYTTPAKTALIFTMEPLSAALFAYLYIGELLLPIQLFGGVMIVVGVLYAELSTLRKAKRIYKKN